MVNYGGTVTGNQSVTGNQTVGGNQSVTGTESITGKTTLAEQETINSADVNGALKIAQSVPTTGNPGTLTMQESAATNGAIGIFVAGDSVARHNVRADGQLTWGPGNGAQDTTLARTGAGILGVSAGSLAVTTAGQGLQIKEGANAKMGTATLNGITEVTVATTAVTATSRIFLTVESPGGTVGGAAFVSSRAAGTSFGIKGIVVGDTSTVAWMIIEPA